MAFITKLSNWTESRTSWAVLTLSALALVATALYMQHVEGLLPCIMCIYQRTAVIGLFLSGSAASLVNNKLTRIVGYLGWAVSSVWGFLLAQEHVEILNAFFAPCEIEPNFPSWAPLHDWFPVMFEAIGDCSDDSWQFLSMGMAEWMRIIFASYFAVLCIVLVCRLLDKRRL